MTRHEPCKEGECVVVDCSVSVVLCQENYRMGGAFQWPGLKEVMEYRETVRELVCDVISSSPLSLPVSMDNPWVRPHTRIATDTPGSHASDSIYPSKEC